MKNAKPETADPIVDDSERVDAHGVDPYARLAVIDRLEIGPVRLEPRRLSAAYKVCRGDAVDTIDLVYSYEEDVFAPETPDSQNLGALIAAQVALNYGLFCRRIHFEGPYDKHDRRFLLNMLRNTAREILVHKLLLPNPFLVEGFGELPAVKRRDYVQAEVTFSEPVTSGLESSAARGSPERHAVLSSGGKDSLLSFGLLRELGRETHPIFVNESGRHWFTAINAYRYSAANYPQTARVWTNSDRVFNWMLRHLSFIRQDFAKKRSDDYPIRLWTVAVFLFGALPILLKRGIGRLLIGDEHDTTLRLSHRGITHYGALYDQSRFFDDAMSRFFHRKGWALAQFSVLRSLSELLIEKILAERYPDLLRHQTSCHATHAQGDRVLPCGKCEKCRRIVGMLLASDIDPALCGYTAEQIDRCRTELVANGIHQERLAAEHLAYLLHQRGAIAEARLGDVRGRFRAEAMSLRFDPERSPPEAFPGDLRRPLFAIFTEHARGAKQRQGRLWVDCEPLSDAALLRRPYPFEGTHASPVSRSQTVKRDYLLGELSWPEAQQRLTSVDLALLPVGSIEQHGRHLPLDTDAYDAEYLSWQVAARCSDPKPLVLPLIPYGVAYHHDDFSGTISVSPDALSGLVYEIGMNISRQGITKLLIINGHGGNSPALKFAAQKINRDAHIFTAVDTGETSDADIAALTETTNDVHAGEVETSTALATRPHLVAIDQASTFVPAFSNRYLDFSSKRSVEWYARTARISPDGVMGDPSKASAEKGKRFWEVMIRNLLDFVEELKGMTLDEIYQRRY